MARPTSALIVDDEPHVRMFVRLLLREVGITTTWEAADGELALALVGQHHPELVLLDVNMPVLGGIATLKRVKEIAPDTMVVMVSSESAMQTVREAAHWGAAGYILKQSPKAEAVQALRETLDAAEEEGEAGEEG